MKKIIEVQIYGPCKECFDTRQEEDGRSVFIYCKHQKAAAVWPKKMLNGDPLFWMVSVPVDESAARSWWKNIFAGMDAANKTAAETIIH